MNKRRIAVIISILIGLGLVYAVYASIQQNQVKQHHQASRNAFEQGDCETTLHEMQGANAINRQLFRFSRVVDMGAYERGQQCKKFLEAAAKQEAGSFAQAFIQYEEILTALQKEPFLVEKKDWRNIGERMTVMAQKQTKAMFEKAEPAGLASEKMCLRLDEFLKEGLIPQVDDNLPAFYSTCGAILFDAYHYGEAANLYQRLLQEYPSYAPAGSLEEKIGQALLREAERASVRHLDQPQRVKTTGSDDDPVIFIQNDSFYEISLALIGSKTIIKTIEGCKDCRKAGSTACTGEALVLEQYEIPSGAYDVVVKAADAQTAIKGAWTLKKGEVYYSCFYVDILEPLPGP